MKIKVFPTYIWRWSSYLSSDLNGFPFSTKPNPNPHKASRAAEPAPHILKADGAYTIPSELII